MTDPTEAIRKALEAGPTSALYTHPRDDNNWMANEAFASACNPAAIRALLDRLDSAERNERRYLYLRALEKKMPGIDCVRRNEKGYSGMLVFGDELDAAIDEQLRSVPRDEWRALHAALSSQGAGEALQKAEAALDKLDQWILDRCPGGPWVALEPLGVLREALKASCRQASQPPDLVPLRIEYEPGYPEDVAFGTQMQMDRLKKWLDKFFAMRAAEAAQPSEAHSDTITFDNQSFAAWQAAQPARVVDERDAALNLIMKMCSDAKEPCSTDPESAGAIRNGKFASIAGVAAQGLGLIRGPSLSTPPAAPTPSQVGAVTELEVQLACALRPWFDSDGGRLWIWPDSAKETALKNAQEALAAFEAKKAGGVL